MGFFLYYLWYDQETPWLVYCGLGLLWFFCGRSLLVECTDINRVLPSFTLVPQIATKYHTFLASIGGNMEAIASVASNEVSGVQLTVILL